MLQGSEAMKVIKAQTAGFCFGVKRAVDQVYDLAAKEKGTAGMKAGDIVRGASEVLKNK